MNGSKKMTHQFSDFFLKISLPAMVEMIVAMRAVIDFFDTIHFLINKKMFEINFQALFWITQLEEKK